MHPAQAQCLNSPFASVAILCSGGLVILLLWVLSPLLASGSDHTTEILSRKRQSLSSGGKYDCPIKTRSRKRKGNPVCEAHRTSASLGGGKFGPQSLYYRSLGGKGVTGVNDGGFFFGFFVFVTRVFKRHNCLVGRGG